MLSDAAPRRTTRSRWTRVVLLGVPGLLLGLAVVALLFPGEVLLVESGEVRADAIVVLGGGLEERPTRAAELFNSGAAPEIIVSGAGDAEGNRRLLESKGVPAAAIEMESKSKSTKQNAQFSIPLLRQLGAKRVIIVTTWYHSRRALKCFRHYAPDIQFYSRPSYFGYPGTAESWQRKALKTYIRAEYLKIPGYWVCYGVWPF
jgi:uncharacterized SAM-binding protein YcdF (DUF218 family)